MGEEKYKHRLHRLAQIKNGAKTKNMNGVTYLKKKY